MFYYLIYAAYILIPLLVGFTFKRYKELNKGWTYLITGVLIFFYPYLVFALERIFLIPDPNHGFGEGDAYFGTGNLFFFLPVSLILQFIFNFFCLKKPIIK